tara:strand:- start:144 stop:1307 length:1164 start_codon:yes stop_codon:yes gene_type:complete
MSSVIYIRLLVAFMIAFCMGESSRSIALYNFTMGEFPANDRIAYELSKGIQKNLVDLIKHDFYPINDFYFIPTKQLDREIRKTRSLLLERTKSHLQSNIITVITNKEIESIIQSISKQRLSHTQLNTISDSLMFFISDMTREITKEMIMSNIVTSDQPTEITMQDFFNFINNTTEQSIGKNTLSSFIASSAAKFDVDIIMIGEYKIDSKRATVNFYMYDYKTFKFINKISAQNSLDKIHILIKDLEFKLLKELGFNLDDRPGSDLDLVKAQLLNYNIDNFSKSDNLLYLSNFFSTEDIKELKMRFQFSDNFNMINYYYKSLFNSLMDTKIPFYLKFYNNESLYPLKRINSVGETSFDVSFSKSNNTTAVSDGSIDYTNIQGIKFGKD